VILHICGDIKAVKKHLFRLGNDALSVDAMVNPGLIKEENSDITTMGNLSTYLLQFGTPEKIQRAARILLEKNIDIIAPACGLSTSTPLENIQAFTALVKEERHG
jgi:[methyl-Co(III) methanol-specific corrinoid protein]:coenzyme M methyltransferase